MRRGRGASSTARTVACLTVGTIVVISRPGHAAGQSELLAYHDSVTLSMSDRGVTAVAFDYSGAELAAGDRTGAVTIYDLRKMATFATIPASGRSVTALAFDRRANTIAIGRDASQLVIWRRHDAPTVVAAVGPVRSLAFSPDGSLVAVGRADGRIALVGVADGRVVGTLENAGKAVIWLAFADNGASLMSVSSDRRIATWDVKRQTQIRETQEPDASVAAATGGEQGQFLILGTETTELPGARGGTGVQRSGGLVYIDRLKFYDVATYTAQKVIDNVTAEPIGLSVSADGKVIAVAQRDVGRSYVALWDVDRGAQIGTIPVPDVVDVVCFSPDGRWLVYGDARGRVAVLTVSGIQPRRAYTADLRGRKYVVTSVLMPLIQPTAPVRVAVLDLDDDGVGADITRAVTDQLTNRLASNADVRLVERRRIAQILGEQNFEHSGRTDPATAVRLARILNVDKIVLGSIARLATSVTISVRLADVATAGIDGVREVQCNSCVLEDLPQAVAELAPTLVAPADSATQWPAAPRIDIDAPNDGAVVRGDSVTLSGTVLYSRPLRGIELVVDGEPRPASRVLGTPIAGKLTRLTGADSSFRFVQRVPINGATSVIAVRAIAQDGNEQEQYVVIHHAPGPPTSRRGAEAADAQPPLALSEVDVALANGRGVSRVMQLVAKFGVDFHLSALNRAALAADGATDALMVVIERRYRPSRDKRTTKSRNE